MKTSQDFYNPGEGLRGSAERLRLNEAWAALSEGRGNQDDWDIAFGDLAEASEYYFVAPAAASPEDLLRREGKRELFARILYLLNVPMKTIDQWRKNALVELNITSAEGER